MTVLIVGGGRPLYFLCRTFLAKGHNVIVINDDAEECTQLARRLKVTVICGDGSDPATLEEAGAAGADAVLAVTSRDQDNLAICQLSVLQYEVPRTLALVNDPDNEDVFRQLGVGAFAPTRLFASLIEQRTAADAITNLLPVADGKVNVTEVKLSGDSPAAGRALRDLELPANALIAVILRNGDAVVPHGDTVLRTGDRLVLLTLPENHGPALRAITGETD
ncbi:MAG TPA: TrkA family potassium uptake protein [Phycisphaerae bacterium]|nr:TrkA family potassium uptake protein [Phycisphaerae bacterium]